MLFVFMAAVGCGSDDDSDGLGGATTAAGQTTASDGGKTGGDASSGEANADGPEPGSPKAEFIRDGNAICRISVAKIQLAGKRAFNQVKKQSDAPAFQRTLVKKVLVPNLEAEVEGLRQLEPPSGDEAEVEKVIASIEEAINRVESNPKAYGYYPYTQAERAADAYGLDLCGQPSL